MLDIAGRLILPLSPEQVRCIVAEADQDGDGQVICYEYLAVQRGRLQGLRQPRQVRSHLKLADDGGG